MGNGLHSNLHALQGFLNSGSRYLRHCGHYCDVAVPNFTNVVSDSLTDVSFCTEKGFKKGINKQGVMIINLESCTNIFALQLLFM